MSAPFDETDFIDRDLQTGQTPRATAPLPVAHAIAGRPPTREELDAKVGEAHNRITLLKREQEELERERATLEEARRRRQEFETGRVEMTANLVRGIGLLEKAEFEARREAEQMAKTLAGFRDALDKVQAIVEESWTAENWNTELTRALTTLENARMEWNSARLKWTRLSGEAVPASGSAVEGGGRRSEDVLTQRGFGQLCKLGLALTWPLALVAALAAVVMVILLLRR